MSGLKERREEKKRSVKKGSKRRRKKREEEMTRKGSCLELGPDILGFLSATFPLPRSFQLFIFVYISFSGYGLLPFIRPLRSLSLLRATLFLLLLFCFLFFPLCFYLLGFYLEDNFFLLPFMRCIHLCEPKLKSRGFGRNVGESLGGHSGIFSRENIARLEGGGGGGGGGAARSRSSFRMKSYSLG